MFDILCVTNRKLCKEDYLTRIEKIAKEKADGIILREKDLSEDEYRELAVKVIKICERYGTTCILHSFAGIAKEINCKALHLPIHILRELSAGDKAGFSILGASCHSVSDAVQAEKLGCTYITAGHIFETDCKKGLSGRGLEFLQSVCESVSIPVYAIGGINSENVSLVRNAGAKGACVMSGSMVCYNVSEYFSAFRKI